jgi:hypothetical protein
MFVGGDARAGSNAPNGHLLMGKAASGSGVNVEMENQSASHDESYLEKQKGQGQRHTMAKT